MVRISRPKAAGSTMIMTLGCLAILTIAAAYTLQRISPRFAAASQFAAWQEARIAAESGIDVALDELEINALGGEGGTWNGWQQAEDYGDPSTGQLGKLAVASGMVTKTNGNGYGVIGNLLTGKLSKAKGVVAQMGNQAMISGPVFLDDLQVASPGNRPTNVDVQLWAVYPTASPYYRWFKIRSMGTCSIPSVALYVASDKRDNALRRYSLREIRPQLRQDDVGTAMSIPTPSTSRVIEVLVEPLLPFELAILTNESLSLATSGSWRVDSYDSRDPAKSGPGGIYPGAESGKVQRNGHIGSNAKRPGDAPYGPLVAARGSAVWGTIGTNGGDDPATPLRENVSGEIAIDPAQVRSDFYREIPPMNRPLSGLLLPPPSPGQPFIAGPRSDPTQYLVTADLGGFAVEPKTTNEECAVTIIVNGNLDVAAGDIFIPPNTTVTIFLRGNADFRDRPINAGGTPQQLQIYGEDSSGASRLCRAFGDAKITAAFYGPGYDVRLMDNVTWCGAVAAKSFEFMGGGTGGFHYDEALNVIGFPIGFRIARYIEDVRE